MNRSSRALHADPKTMRILARLFRIREEKNKWENPRSSVGERRGSVQNGKYTCWEAVGPVRETWIRLGPEIKEYVESSCKYGPTLSLEIYMIGRTEDKAAPTILVCSADPTARKEVRRAIGGSGVLDKYPPIDLGDASKLPDLLAQEDSGSTFPLDSNLGEESIVFSSPLDNAFGRRIFIPRRDNGSLRPVTAGPILHINGNIYQLTVGHAFLEFDSCNLSEIRSSSLDDCDFDGQSTSEDEDSTSEDKEHKTSKGLSSHDECCSSGNHICAKLQDSSFSGPAPSLSSEASHTMPSLSGDFASQNDPAGGVQSPRKDSMIIRKLDRAGKLAILSETGTKQSLDYALVELEGVYRDGDNEVACEPNGTQRWLRVRKVAKIDSDAKVVTMTASLGLLSGKICSTASYMRQPNQRTFQELYSVRLDGKLAHGDCGSGVIDQVLGDLYGHIVAGSIGTGFAYIVPAMQVFEDLLDRLGGDVTLVPVSPKHSKHFLTDRAGLEPLRLVEFASKQYFSELKRPNLSNSDKKNIHQSTVITSTLAASSILSIDHQMPGKQREGTNSPFQSPSNQQTSSKLPKLRSPLGNIRLKMLTDKFNTPTSKVESKGEEIEGDQLGGRSGIITSMQKRQKTTDVAGLVTFENRFFALPSDLQVQIIASLRIPDILNLRAVSKNWHSLISLNERPISRASLEHNPIPAFAMSLYPLPEPSDLSLHYICGQWHRLNVVSKLSAVMTDWITKDAFLRTTEVKQLEFLPQKAHMRRRLVPLLFVISHFFETYRRLHIKRLLEQGHGLLREAFTTNPIEIQIMSLYDNETLLQVHQVFPLLVSALCRALRPPSYLSRIERFLRGYRKGPPPPHIHVAILFMGGLRKIVEFLEIEEYEARRKAVDDWYASIIRESVYSESQSSHQQVGVEMRPSRQASLGADIDSIKNIASVSASISSPPGLVDSQDGSASSSTSGCLLFNTSLAARSPKSQLYAKHAQLVLPDLPALEEIWLPTAEALLLTRRAVERRQDIKKCAQVMLELIREDITDADELFDTRTAYDII